MKKVLFIGPIGGFYGRDIEVNLAAKSLFKEFEIVFFSTGHWQKNTTAINGISSPVYSSLDFELNKKPIIKLFTFLSWTYNRFKTKKIDYIKNKVNKKIIKKLKWDIKILEEQIAKCDTVFCFVQLSSNYLKDIIEISSKNNNNIIIRTTGTIYNLPLEINILEKVDLFIHHSIYNKNQLQKYINHKHKIIDQGCSLENKLLKINTINIDKELVFGFLGRYTNVKGIVEIIEVASDLNIKLVLAGDGFNKKELLKNIKSSSNIIDLGKLNYNEIYKFYNLIDVFLINSEHETGPLTGLEAMCAARFVISRKVGAMPKRLESNPNKWINSSLKAAVEEVLRWDKQKISDIANENRRIYMKNYRLHHIQKEYLKAIKSL